MKRDIKETLFPLAQETWAKDHHECVSAPSETTLVWLYYFMTIKL
jgi:hypothetical protein